MPARDAGMTELVERVALAMQREAQERGCKPIPGFVVNHLAAAAIEAMREPTEGMCEGGSHVTWWNGKDDEEWEENVSPYRAKDIYQAMLDEALK